MSKGSRNRVTDHKAYEENFEGIRWKSDAIREYLDEIDKACRIPGVCQECMQEGKFNDRDCDTCERT